MSIARSDRLGRLRSAMSTALGGLRTAIVSGRIALGVGLALFVISAVAFRLARRDAGFWTIDDAGITYAAAYELADHGSLAPYVGGTPTESYSNPLLFFLAVLLRLVGVFDPVRTHVHLEMLVFASMVTLVWAMLRAWTGQIVAAVAAVVFAGVELATPATWTWYGSGLENVWVSAGLVLLLWICARTARGVPLAAGWGIGAFVVAITRPEAPVYVATFYAALIMFSRPSDLAWRPHAKRVARTLAVTVGCYVAFLVWRRIAYADWWPNTFYAKVGETVSLRENLRTYVVAQVLPYGSSAVFAATVIALLLARQLEALALSLVLFLIGSLALPVTAGADWMGEHRFATPFFAIAHVAYASLVATSLAQVVRAQRRWQLVPVVSLVAVLGLSSPVWFGKMAVRDRVEVNPVTLAHIARVQGGERWIHQLRLGLPYAVVSMPDAGGSLMVGGMQLLDSGLLADFQQARVIRYDTKTDLRFVNQYQNAERRPDLVDFNMQSAFVDVTYLGTSYLRADSHLAARVDTVKRDIVDPAARLAFELPGMKIYLSPQTVERAAPGALVRCELLVEWTQKQADPVHALRASLGGERDQIWLAPYHRDADHGVEMRALLIGAPLQVGTYPISIEVGKEGEPWRHAILFHLRVTEDTSDLPQLAESLVRDVPPLDAARRIAWLREQLVPRLSIGRLRHIMRRLEIGTLTSGSVGRHVHELRWNARLAAFEALPASIRDAEAAATRAVLSLCATAETVERSRHALCIGRKVDELRRLGYLDPLSHDPTSARVLAQARDHLATMRDDQRYVALVGLALADPSDMDLQRALLAARRSVGRAGEFPPLE